MALDNAAAQIDAEAAANTAPAPLAPVMKDGAGANAPPVPAVPKVAPAIFAAFTAPPPNVSPPTLMPAAADCASAVANRTTAATAKAAAQSAAVPDDTGAGANASAPEQAAALFGAWGLLSMCVPTLQPATASPGPAAETPVRRRTSRARRRKQTC